MRKLNFDHHIFSLHENDLARKVAEVQFNNNFPGLMSEVKCLLRNYELNDVETEDYTKKAWRKLVKEKVTEYTKAEMLDKMKSLKKIKHEEKVKEEFELKQYFKSMNLQRARMKFGIESEMVFNFKFNYIYE